MTARLSVPIATPEKDGVFGDVAIDYKEENKGMGLSQHKRLRVRGQVVNFEREGRHFTKEKIIISPVDSYLFG